MTISVKYFLKLDHQFVRRYLKVMETQMLKRFGLKLPWKPDASFDHVHKYDRASLKLLSVKLASRYVASGKFENCMKKQQTMDGQPTIKTAYLKHYMVL